VTRRSPSAEARAFLAVDRETRLLLEELRELVEQERAESKRRRNVIRPGEIVSEDRAARALPIRRSDAVGWLRREGLSVKLDGRRVVIWDQVVARLGGSQPPSPPPQSKKKRKTDPGPPLLATPGRMFG